MNQPPGYPPSGHSQPMYAANPTYPQPYQQGYQNQAQGGFPALDMNALAALQGLGSDNTSNAFGGDSVPRVSINKRVFRLISGGTEIYANPNPMEFIIVAAAPHVARNFYANGYVDGSKDRPTCSSMNGVVPDRDVAQPQFTNCAQCPMNREGTGANGKGRACKHSQTIAVCLPDKLFESAGNIFSMRIPAVSLFSSDPSRNLYGLQGYAKFLKGSRSTPAQVVTLISWNLDETLAMWFSPTRVLTPAEYQQVLALQVREDTLRAISADEDGNVVSPPPQQVALPAPPAPVVPSYGVQQPVYNPQVPPAPVYQAPPQQPVYKQQQPAPIYQAPPPAPVYQAPPQQQPAPAYQPQQQPVYQPPQEPAYNPNAAVQQRNSEPAYNPNAAVQQQVAPQQQQQYPSMFDQPQGGADTAPTNGLTRPPAKRGRSTAKAGQTDDAGGAEVPPPIVRTGNAAGPENGQDEDVVLSGLVGKWTQQN